MADLFDTIIQPLQKRGILAEDLSLPAILDRFVFGPEGPTIQGIPPVIGKGPGQVIPIGRATQRNLISQLERINTSMNAAQGDTKAFAKLSKEFDLVSKKLERLPAPFTPRDPVTLPSGQRGIVNRVEPNQKFVEVTLDNGAMVRVPHWELK